MKRDLDLIGLQDTEFSLQRALDHAAELVGIARRADAPDEAVEAETEDDPQTRELAGLLKAYGAALDDVLAAEEDGGASADLDAIKWVIQAIATACGGTRTTIARIIDARDEGRLLLQEDLRSSIDEARAVIAMTVARAFVRSKKHLRRGRAALVESAADEAFGLLEI